MIAERGGLGNTGFEGFIRALTLQFAPPECIPLSLRFKETNKRASDEQVDPNDPFFFDTREVLTGMPMPLKSRTTRVFASSVQRLPHGFRCLLQEGALSINTAQLLCRIDDARRRYDPQQVSRPYTISAGGGWQPAQYSDFWECCPSISRRGPDLEKYLSLALMLYTANEFAPQRVFHKGLALYSGPRSFLASEISTLDRVQLTQSGTFCWMWIWWVLIDSWIEDGMPTEVSNLLISQFWAMFPAVRDSTGLTLVLKQFFWNGKFEAGVRQLLSDEDGTTTLLKETGDESSPPLYTNENQHSSWLQFLVPYIVPCPPRRPGNLGPYWAA